MKLMEKPREDERFLEVGAAHSGRVMGPTKAVPDTQKVGERWEEDRSLSTVGL